MFFIWACDGEKKLQQQNKWETALMAPIRTRFSARHCLANSHVIRRVWHVIANASILFHVSPFAVNWNPLFLARTTWVQFNSVDWDQSEPIASSLGFISISASFVSLSGCLNWKSKKKNFYVKRLGRSWQNLREFVKIAPLDGYATRIDWLQFSAKPRTWHFWLTVWCRWLHKTRQIITRHWESSSYLWNMKEFPTIFVGAWVVGGRGKKGVNILCVTFRCCENGQIGTSSDTPGRRANRTSFVSNQNRQCFPPDLVTPN